MSGISGHGASCLVSQSGSNMKLPSFFMSHHRIDITMRYRYTISRTHQPALQHNRPHSKTPSLTQPNSTSLQHIKPHSNTSGLTHANCISLQHTKPHSNIIGLTPTPDPTRAYHVSLQHNRPDYYPLGLATGHWARNEVKPGRVPFCDHPLGLYDVHCLVQPVVVSWHPMSIGSLQLFEIMYCFWLCM